ncbi:MAG: hypothetical protein ACJ77A_03880 [Actinomycetota bacterium]
MTIETWFAQSSGGEHFEREKHRLAIRLQRVGAAWLIEDYEVGGRSMARRTSVISGIVATKGPVSVRPEGMTLGDDTWLNFRVENSAIAPAQFRFAYLSRPRRLRSRGQVWDGLEVPGQSERLAIAVWAKRLPLGLASVEIGIDAQVGGHGALSISFELPLHGK